MTKYSTHIAALGTTLTALIAATIAFPVIAETSRENDTASRVAEVLAAPAVSVDAQNWLQGPVDTLLVSQSATFIAENLEKASDRICLAEAVYYEARSETKAGQRAVAEVVMNRVDNKHFPSTVCDVVYEGSERQTGCQFSFTCDGSMDITPKGKAWKRSLDIADLVLSGGHHPITNRATHYHTTEVTPKWSDTMRMTRHVGSHVFYRFAPRNYKPSEPMVLMAPPI